MRWPSASRLPFPARRPRGMQEAATRTCPLPDLDQRSRLVHASASSGAADEATAHSDGTACSDANRRSSAREGRGGRQAVTLFNPTSCACSVLHLLPLAAGAAAPRFRYCTSHPPRRCRLYGCTQVRRSRTLIASSYPSPCLSVFHALLLSPLALLYRQVAPLHL
jgi:hypothetical protein